MIKNLFPFTSIVLQVAIVSSSYGQTKIDTLRYSAAEAETVFLNNNLPLLAERLNINQAEARILQAKVWPNPTFTLNELQLYKNATTEAIPGVAGNFWRNRNFAMQIEQLILTAGKRQKNVNLEIQNKEMSENLLTDLLLALKAEFRQTVSEVLYLQNVQNSWLIQLREVTRQLTSQESQLKQGFISQADLFRLKALQISLRGEITALADEMSERQKSLKTLMYIDPKSYLVIVTPANVTDIARFKAKTLDELISLSANNPRLKASQSQIRINQAQLEIEKANRIPNVNLMASYDRAGSTMLNFLGVGASIDLPLFNRNKGNIQVAKFEIDKSNLLKKNVEASLNNAIVKHWNDLNQSISLYESIDKDYIEKLDQMTIAIGRNFSQHNISLLQFLDYYESFRESKEKYYHVIKNITIKNEEINYLIGGEL